MKKIMLALTALSMSTAMSACSMNHDAPPPPPRPMAQNDDAWQGWDHKDWDHKSWDHKEHMKMMTEYFFNKMDKNGDGYVTKKEYDEYYRKWFREADTNHDGRLTIEEVRAQMKREMKRMKADMDEMHNGGSDERSSNDNANSSSYSSMSPSSSGMNDDNGNSGYSDDRMNANGESTGYDMNNGQRTSNGTGASQY